MRLYYYVECIAKLCVHMSQFWVLIDLLVVFGGFYKALMTLVGSGGRRDAAKRRARRRDERLKRYK